MSYTWDNEKVKLLKLPILSVTEEFELIPECPLKLLYEKPAEISVLSEYSNTKEYPIS